MFNVNFSFRYERVVKFLISFCDSYLLIKTGLRQLWVQIWVM